MGPAGGTAPTTLIGVPVASEARLLVFHGLRLGGFVEPEVVAARYGLPIAEVTDLLAAALDAGLVRRRDGRVSGWLLTADGRTEGEQLLEAELDGAGARPAVAAAYERFMQINKELLAACTAWQVRDESSGALNDHSDPDHDARVIARLGDVDDAVQPICTDLASTLDRFGSYGPRLATARRRVEDGDVDWFTKPMIDSYHTVWFELHEDLLATLRIERSTEGEG
jgi:hypothetical protein